jgi:nucleoside-diphosphate-sugar epimerase
LNFPPHRRDDIVAYHRKQYEALIKQIEHSNVKNVLMVSSTSVYPSSNKVVVETDAKNPEKGSGEALLIVEDLLQNIKNRKTTIVRFGGLIGYDRNPARFLASKTDLKDGNSPVNLIHRDDCIAIISEIIKQEKWGEIYNACCDEHPTRKEFYTLAAQKSGFAIPEFVDDESSKQFKIIDSSKLKAELAYTFKYKSPLDSL